jgi:hypothetical protein
MVEKLLVTKVKCNLTMIFWFYKSNQSVVNFVFFVSDVPYVNTFTPGDLGGLGVANIVSKTVK